MKKELTIRDISKVDNLSVNASDDEILDSLTDILGEDDDLDDFLSGKKSSYTIE